MRLSAIYLALALVGPATAQVIFATRIDGDVMSVREKGPIFVIHPFDEAPDLYNKLGFGRSVWQVTPIEVF